jgi:phosphatidylglycerophosphatase A
MIKTFNSLLVTMFGIGKIKIIPGTFGSLATTIFLYFVFHIIKLSPNIVLIGLLVIFIDEFIGQSIPIYLYEISHGTQKTSDEAIIFYGICFVLFRIFDILKPFPVNYFDKNYKNSFGVIMDDVCAGLYVVLSLICFMLLSSYLI